MGKDPSHEVQKQREGKGRLLGCSSQVCVVWWPEEACFLCTSTSLLLKYSFGTGYTLRIGCRLGIPSKADQTLIPLLLFL